MAPIEENNGEPILESIRKPFNISERTKSTTAIHFLLSKAEENVRKGKTNWITNSITGECITHGEIEPMSRTVAQNLKLKGMKEGDMAIYLSTNVTQIYTIVLGVWRLGGCMHSSYAEDTKDILLERILETKAKWMFCDPISVPQSLAAAKEAPWPVEVFVFGEAEGCTSAATLFVQSAELLTLAESGASESYSWENEIVQGNMDDPVLILCTSGTTGKSKGAIYTNKNFLAFCLALEFMSVRSAPVLYLIKATHVGGILFPLRNIASGTWTVMMNQITKENMFQATEKYKPFLVYGFPGFLTSFVDDPEAESLNKSSLEIMATGGIVIKPIIYETLMKLPNMKFVTNGYGMTECIGVASTMDLSSPTFKVLPSLPPCSVGRLYPNTSLKILDLNTGKALGPNKSGELAFKSPIQCVGYWKRPVENEQTFIDGWMKTGDMGHYDENGFIFITGRIKDNFKYFNNHISPEELEEIILRHEAVAEVCVFGIPDAGGDVPRAAVVLKSGFSPTPEEIEQFANDKVASYKNIRGGVYFVPSLPRGNSGKVLRSAVAATGSA